MAGADSFFVIFTIAEDSQAATQEDTGGKGAMQKPENERNESSSSKVETDILQSYGRASSSNATWHDVDEVLKKTCLCF